ncbi:MAG TPA: tRNA (guanosine(37)-N1)-methyltransferase TrmD [Steroidobacteraceae bacterium]|nr:tRNA (guanosine(37)-N1)-methyltransferase TrmD [Steroidobacteraceae bacterium]
MKIEVVTLFPEMIRQVMQFGVTGRAVKRGLLSVGTEDPREHTHDVHRTVDDRPYGGGPGMLMKPEPLTAAIAAAAARVPPGSRRIYLSAQGRRFDQAYAEALKSEPGVVLVAGRYEGIDERVIATSIDEELSVGDYVLSGGELPALTVIDAVARLMDGALNDARSSAEESFADGLLDWPHYTRPVDFAGLTVPEVLQGGDHARIRRWRLKQALGRTWRRRPDLFLSRRASSAEEVELLNEYLQERQNEP